MKKWLSFKETVFVMSMLFGLFFGAGNLIFPVYMGQLAGQNIWHAIIGFLITGVTLPLLAVAALGKSRSRGLFDFGQKVSKPYSIFFTCLLYLTIGPCFAIPRCATVAFTIGIEPLVNTGDSRILFIYSFVFFTAASYFALRGNKILTWVGKLLNPLFLLFLGILLIRAFVSPMGDIASIVPSGSYDTSPLFNGFYEGYNTMDALAGLAFGIIVVTVIRDLGIGDGDGVAANTIVAGITSCVLMGIIYIALTFAGAKSTSVLGVCSNGGEVLRGIAQYYFGDFGTLLLAIIVTLACLKTAVGLITSCAKTFEEVFPNKLSNRNWTILFLLASFIIANFGLNTIIQYSIPFLMFLYPLAMVMIFLALASNLFHKTPFIYRVVVYVTIPFATLEFVKSLPFDSELILRVNTLVNILPLGSLGLSWVLPAFISFAISYIYAKRKYKVLS